MSCLTATIVLAIAGFAVVAGQLPSCDSIFRFIPSYAHYFTHCDCLRSEWTDWSAINRDELKGAKMNRQQSANEPEPLPVDPKPFDVDEHGSRYRRSHRDNCREQYILFVLDASGSVGKQWFDRVTELLAELVLFFCKPIRVATMTFDDRFFAEFCFDEFDNTLYGRNQTGAAMRSINYMRHGSLTHTAGAAKCACDYMLNSTSCGLPVDADCIDVI